jgi:hypothetical protein
MTSPLLANVKGGDARNYGVAKRASLWVRPFGSILDADWDEIGNLADLSAIPEITQLEHKGNRRGALVRDRVELTERKLTLDVKLDEVKTSNLQRAFGSSIAKVVGTATVRDGKIVKNPGNGGTIDIGLINADAIIVRSTNEEGAVTTYIPTTDYTVVLATGIITITAGALTSATAVPEIHIYFRKDVATETFQMFDGTVIRLEAEYQVLTTSGARIVMHLPNAVITNKGNITFGLGDKWIEMPLTLEALADTSGSLGEFHVIDAAAVV